jgi:hypothetical protein
VVEMGIFSNGKVKGAPEEVELLQRELLHNAQLTFAHPPASFDASVMYEATAQSVRDRLVERWLKTEEHYTKTVRTHHHVLPWILPPASSTNHFFRLFVPECQADILPVSGVSRGPLLAERNPELEAQGATLTPSTFFHLFGTSRRISCD